MAQNVFYNVCPTAGCHMNCVLKLWVEDGKLQKVESIDYPDDPAERCICLRGLSSPRLVYHPDRLKHPLKRVGERGAGKWVRISWEEAFDIIAGKLVEIKEKYGPQALKIIYGGSSSDGILLSGRLLGLRFGNLWGSGGYFENLGWVDDGAAPAASLITLGVAEQDHGSQDFVNSKVLILWGWNPAVTAYREMKYILDARDKGVKLVVISPVFNATAAKADWWLPIRAGTDAALALAMINVIINARRHDVDAIARHTVGPFLVDEETKCFLRHKEKYLVWDDEAQTPKPHDAAAYPALQGSYRVEGIRCKPAFALLLENAALYPPEKAAEVTGIPADTIRKLALEYATGRPSAIRVGFGMTRTYHGCLNYRAIITLAAICGYIGKPGGGASAERVSSPLVLNYQSVVSPEIPAATPPASGIERSQGGVSQPAGMKTIPGAQNAIRAWAAIRDEKPYPIKALIRTYRNSLVCSGHMDGWREIYSKLELIVVSDIFMTRTARWADMVLPEAMVFERDDIGIKRNYLMRLEKAIEPPGEAKTPLEIWSELARRVGLGAYFRHSARDYMKMLLECDHPTTAGITLERLEREKVVRGHLPLKSEIPFRDHVFPTPSGRIEFYQEHLREFGEELPLHKESLESPRRLQRAQKYPLTFFTVKWHMTTHSALANVDWMRAVAPETVLHINPQDAGPRDIHDSDVVVVFNDRGRVKLKARLNEAFPPGTVNIYHGWWPEQFMEGHYNDLLHRIDDVNIVSPAMEVEPIISSSTATAALIQYDCLVEVKKA